MKKLLIAATLAAAALGTTSILAEPGHQRGPRQAGATAADCPMAGEQGTREERRAEMQKRMQEMHASMGTHEGHGPGRGRQGEHQH